jgi:hypothetical protein
VTSPERRRPDRSRGDLGHTQPVGVPGASQRTGFYPPSPAWRRRGGDDAEGRFPKRFSDVTAMSILERFPRYNSVTDGAGRIRDRVIKVGLS